MVWVAGELEIIHYENVTKMLAISYENIGKICIETIN